jgi:hypothetical protein
MEKDMDAITFQMALYFGNRCFLKRKETRLKIASVLTRVNKSVSSLGQD